MLGIVRRGRLARLVVLTTVSLISSGFGSVEAQQATPPESETPEQPKAQDQSPLPPMVNSAIPADPDEPIAKINGQVITRGQLASECVARYGTEVLDTLIARTLIEQAIQQSDLEVSADEVDAEIERNAQSAGLNRKNFLRALARERNISPRQYAQYIAYPAVALRKLAKPRVQVTKDDLDKAFEAYYGEKLHCRMIMVKTLAQAKDVWNELRANPGGFAQIARERSIDPDSRAMGGLLAQPIVRHSDPLHVSKAAFEQLVDGNPNDKNPEHKPKDGDITGPIQVAENAWVILKRERLEPPQEVDRNNEERKAQLRASIQEAKIKEEMKTVMKDLFVQAAIDNHLTGRVKPSGQEQADVQVSDKAVQRARMSKPDQEVPPSEALKAIQGGTGQIPAPIDPPSGVPGSGQ